MTWIFEDDWKIMQEERGYTAPWNNVLNFYKKKYNKFVLNNSVIDMQEDANKAFIDDIEHPSCCWNLCCWTQDTLSAPSWAAIEDFYKRRTRSYWLGRAQNEQAPKLII